MGDGPADDGAGAQHLPGRGGQGLEPGQQQVTHGGRELGPAAQRQQLFGEEGVPLGAGVDLVEERPGGRHTEDVADLVCLLVASERLEHHPVVGTPPQLGGEPDHPGVARRLVGAQREHEQDPAAQLVREESEQLARGTVGPVEVLDHEHQRLLGGDRVEELAARLEQAADAGRSRLRCLVVRGESGDQTGQLRPGRPGPSAYGVRAAARDQVAEELGDRGVGEDLLAERYAPADEHLAAGGLHGVAELLDGAALADPGRPLDQDRAHT